MRTVTNIFIVNLAIADLLVIILCLPATVVWDVTETWFLGEAMCKGVLYLQVRIRRCMQYLCKCPYALCTSFENIFILGGEVCYHHAISSDFDSMVFELYFFF